MTVASRLVWRLLTRETNPERYFCWRRMVITHMRRPCDAPNCKLLSRKNKQEKEPQMKNYEVEYRIESIRLEAQNYALLKEIRTAESAALRHALGEILGIFKHWTFGLSQVQNSKTHLTP
jgi:hypothetical protein